VNKSNRTPAPVRRSQLRAEVTALTRRSLDQHGVDQQDIAVVTSARYQTVQTWCDDGQPATIPLADVVGLGHSYPVVALDHLRWAAEKLGHELRPVAEAGDDRDAMHLVHESLDVIRTVTEAMADGAIDAREARTMLREIDDVDAAMAKTRARLRAIVADHEANARRLS